MFYSHVTESSFQENGKNNNTDTQCVSFSVVLTDAVYTPNSGLS